MSQMETLVTIIHVVVAIFMILVVLFQGGNAGGVGAAFGGGNSSGLLGASGANSFLTKLTYGAATVFMFTSIGMTVLQGQANKTGLLKKLEASAPGVPTPVAAEPAAAPAAVPAAVPAPAAAAPDATVPQK